MMKKNLLKALLSVLPKYSAREFLTGLFFDFDKKRIVSTDGHCLVMVECPGEIGMREGRAWVGSGEAWEFIKRELRSEKQFFLESLFHFLADDTRARGIIREEVRQQYADMYPDVDKDIPADVEGVENGKPIFLDWKYLKVIEDIEKAVTPNVRRSAVYQLPEKKNSPLKAVIRNSDGLRVTVVIMPVNVPCVNFPEF